jgi:hypothetical protein
MSRLRLLLPALLVSCQVGGLYDDAPEVRVEIFDTQSERRFHEFDLTHAVVHELSARGIRVNAPEAPYTLKGRILDIRTPAVVDQTRTDVVVVGSVLFRLEILLVKNATGDLVWRDERVETVSYTSQRGETFHSARAEIFDRLARWIVTRFEKEW